MSRGRATLHAVVAALSLLGCTLELDRGQDVAISFNECSQNSDCGPGECWQGACVARDTELPSVLVEITPPLGEVGPSVGGLRFLKHLTDVSRSSSDNVIDLQPATRVVGSLLAPPDACGKKKRSFPVEVIFTPREDSYGLPVDTYKAETKRISIGANTHCASDLEGMTEVDRFSVWVPSGSYDIYVKPLPTPDDEPECVVAPQLIRRSEAFGNVDETCLPIPWIQPHKVSVNIPFLGPSSGAGSLDDWKIDVVHPLTGRVLSSQALLSREFLYETPMEKGYRRDVYYGPVPPDQAVKELIRLTPPAGIVAPVIQADRTGLQVTSAEATFPPLGPFLPAIKLHGSVAPAEDSGPPPSSGISGRAYFTAVSLKGIKPGVFASHSTVVGVGSDGTAIAELLPGEYRLRVVPDVGTGYAATETSQPIQCPTDPVSGVCLQPEQFGRRFPVRRAAALMGDVVDSTSGERVEQISVDAVPAFVGTRSCASNPGNAACAGAPVGILDIALGDEAFVPRSVSGIVQSGRFTLDGLDCGECTAESGALFDIAVKPPVESRRAWGLKPGITVISGEQTAGVVDLPFPVIYRGTLEVRPPSSEGVAVPGVPVRALVRAYVLRDENGAVITDPAGVPSCTMLAASGVAASSRPCIRSVLQVAETTSDDLGLFELVLPSRIDAN